MIFWPEKSYKLTNTISFFFLVMPNSKIFYQVDKNLIYLYLSDKSQGSLNIETKNILKRSLEN